MFFLNVLVILLLFQCVYSENERRLVLHSGDDIALEFQTLRQEIEALKINQTHEIQALKSTQARELETLKINHTQEIQALKSSQAQEIQALKSSQAQEISALNSEVVSLKKDLGSTYVRWGKTLCDGNETEKVYSGFASGSPYELDGGAASCLCLPEHPTWAKYVDGLQNIGGKISGAEYEIWSFDPFPQPMLNQDAPCAVCRSPRPTTIMIPGRTSCYTGWTMEYTGYLMTDNAHHKAGTDYACVDARPEAVYHGEADLNGKLFYFTEVKCGSLPCQEYPDGRELACVVCSK